MTVPRMRAGTSDRQAAVDGLTRHFTEGRLTVGEFDERVGTAYAATYLDEFPELFADLPAAHPGRGAGPCAHRSDPDEVDPYRPPAPPGPWSSPPRPPRHRPQRILPVLAVLAVVFLIGLFTHGLFLFPVGWVAFFLMFNGGGHRVDPAARNNNHW